MKNTRRLVLAIASIFWALASPPLAPAQAVGNNAVYNSTNGVTFSTSFIDASMFLSPNSTLGRDVCDAIYRLLSGFPGFPPYPSTGAVIDARGISGATNLTCTHGSPWTEGSNTVTVPSTILLPAGTIIIPATWVLPNYTRLVGAGDALDYLSTGTVSVGTTLQACLPSVNHCSSSFSGSDMIDLGTSQLCPASVCNSVSVENLTLDGLGQSLNGIVNTSAKTGSHVDHVSLFQLLGTGLSLSGNASK
ncbi:MAG TPA: hypothetical protein VK788_13500 [Terriglobales bacterium]|nr:hypothetical protein [Terriglobales bacterium]